MAKKEAAPARGVSLEDLVRGGKTIEAPIKDGERVLATLTVTYDPERLTGRLFEQMTGAQGLESAVAIIACVVTGWDLLMRGVAVLPGDREALLDVPLFVLTAVLQAVMGDMQPDPK